MDRGRDPVTGPDTLAVAIRQPVPAGTPPDSHLLAVLIGLDVFVNALLGGRAYQTISSRLGENIAAGGWAARVPWPAWWLRHCRGAVYTTEV